MRFITSLLPFLGLVPFTFAGYAIQDDYSPDKFLNMFDFGTVRPSFSRAFSTLTMLCSMMTRLMDMSTTSVGNRLKSSAC